MDKGHPAWTSPTPDSNLIKGELVSKSFPPPYVKPLTKKVRSTPGKNYSLITLGTLQNFSTYLLRWPDSILSLTPHNVTIATDFPTEARSPTRLHAASSVLALTARQTDLLC